MALAYGLYVDRRESVLRTAAILASVGAQDDIDPDVLDEVVAAFEASDPAAARRLRREKILAALAAF